MEFIVLWVEAKVLTQFVWSRYFNVHNYEGLSGCI